MRICKHIRCIMETMCSRRRHMFIYMKKQMGCRKRKFMISPDFMVLRNLYLYRYSLLWRLFAYAASAFFVILNLIAGRMKKFLALYFVLIGSMVISGLMGDTIPWLSIIILTIILGILYLLCESTEIGYGYFGRFLNMLLDNLYYLLM